MLGAILRPLSRLPLAWLHALGTVLGWAVYLASPRYARRLRENFLASGLFRDDAERGARLRRAVGEAGKAVAEIAAIWLRPTERVLALVVETTGDAAVAEARARGRGVLFLTPHMGCFEITSLHLARRLPMTVLYRPPKLAWLEPLMVAGRERAGVQLATTDASGVRRMLKALRRGEGVGLLPDQVPGAGSGEWAPFFGRPAYTMTLVNRLRRTSGCATVLLFGERLPRGGGYRIHFESLPDTVADEAGLNRAIESVIARRPSQYLWSYNRYKVPAGVDAPPAGAVAGRTA